MNGVTAYGEPVEEWRGAQVEILAEEVLVQLDGRFRVPPDSELKTGRENDVGVAQALYGCSAEVEYRVKCVAANRLNLVRDKRRTLVIGLVEETIDGPR